MTKYRKLPVEIEAWSVRELIRSYRTWDSTALFPRPLQEALQLEAMQIVDHDHDDATIYFVIKTLEGDMVASGDDMIIKGVAGELYPCKASIFEKTYEEVQ